MKTLYRVLVMSTGLLALACGSKGDKTAEETTKPGVFFANLKDGDTVKTQSL